MKKILLILSLAITIGTGALARPIETRHPGITCDLRKLNPDEVEKLMFNEEATRFLSASLRGVDAFEISHNGYTHGHHGVAADTSQIINLKNIHERFQPFIAAIKNNTNRPITIFRGQFISNLTEALTTYKRLIKHYPSFMAQRVGWIIGAVISTLATIFCLTTIAASALLIVPAILMGAMTWMSIHFALWAQRLRNKRARLARTKPVMIDQFGNKRKVKEKESVTIMPGEKYFEKLLVLAQSVQTSSAIFGNSQAPELVYVQQ